jgi:hypothetical protein
MWIYGMGLYAEKQEIVKIKAAALGAGMQGMGG